MSKLAQMENPYKEPQKGCILCNVTVDYKNIQVSRDRAAFRLVLHCVTFLWILSHDTFHRNKNRLVFYKNIPEY